MMKKLLLILLLFAGGCSQKDWPSEWHEKGSDAESGGDYVLALKCYQTGAQKGDPLCMERIADFYKWGWGGLPCDDAQALQWYQKSADAGFISCYIDIGNLYLHGGTIPKDTDKAIDNFKLAASKGDPKGYVELGKLYYEGGGVEKDYKRAYKYFKKADSEGCFDARIDLAIMYAKGHYVEQSDEKAIELFSHLLGIVRDKEFLTLQLSQIGTDYLQGISVKKDPQKGFMYIELAAEWGDNRALLTLASMYGYGIGTEKDISKAESIFQKALEQADPLGKYYYEYTIGNFYLQAYDPPLYDKAIEYLTKAAEDSNAAPNIAASAMLQISVLYLSDGVEGIIYDEEKGKEWFNRAVNVYQKEAEEGWPYYMYQLAGLYEEGADPTRDLEKALYWYRKAADEGHPEAKLKVEELEKQQGM